MKPPTFAPVYLSLFPHLAKIANEHGYALAAHGSVVRDMDLVAVPWTDEADEPSMLMSSLADYLKLYDDIWGTGIDGPTKKPHGRVSYKLYTGFGSAIDLSVMPRAQDYKSRLP